MKSGLGEMAREFDLGMGFSFSFFSTSANERVGIVIEGPQGENCPYGQRLLATRRRFAWVRVGSNHIIR